MTDIDVFALPSYEDSRRPNAWPFILRFLDRRDLVTLSQVSRSIQASAQAALWTGPRKHWATHDVTVLDCFHGFLHSLELAASVSGGPHLYTRTLNLSFLGSESLSFTLPKGWVSNLMPKLPNLRSLIISGTDTFGHESINHTIQVHENLRLLSIRTCPNLTSKALSLLLKSVPNLYYLEVSQCPQSKGPNVMQAISELSKLHVLKVPGNKYSDDAVQGLVHRIVSARAESRSVMPQNLRCLDITDNNLSDAIVEGLNRLGEALPSAEEPPPYDSERLGDIESSPSIASPQGGWSIFLEARLAEGNEKDNFSDEQEKVVQQVQEHDFRSPVETGLLGQGLTHLYLSGNNFSAQGVQALMECLPLETLDVGDVQGGRDMAASLPNAVPEEAVSIRVILDTLASSPRLTSLRINHRIVTGFSGCGTHGTVQNQSANVATPYPYSWLRYEGTQWDPTILRSGHVKRFQFTPALLALEKLKLTSVPHSVLSESFTACLQSFIDAAGDMQRITELYQQRKASQTKLQNQVPRRSSALKDVQLEVQQSRSVREQYDADTAAYEQASRDDFSFFSEEKDAYVTTHRMRSPQDRPQPSLNKGSNPVDVVASLSAFRRQQRERSDPHAHPKPWTGKLGVIRRSEA